MLKNYNKEFCISLAGRIVMALVSVVVMTLFGFLFSVYLAPKHYVTVTFAWAVLMYLIGAIYYYRGYYDRWQTISVPWSIETTQSRLASSPLLNAFIIKEFLMAGVVSLFEIVDLVKTKRALNSMDEKRMLSLISAMSESAKSGRRFRPASDYSSHYNEIGIMIRAGIVWEKIDKGNVLFGVNRKYQI